MCLEALKVLFLLTPNALKIFYVVGKELNYLSQFLKDFIKSENLFIYTYFDAFLKYVKAYYVERNHLSIFSSLNETKEKISRDIKHKSVPVVQH